MNLLETEIHNPKENKREFINLCTHIHCKCNVLIFVLFGDGGGRRWVVHFFPARLLFSLFLVSVSIHLFALCRGEYYFILWNRRKNARHVIESIVAYEPLKSMCHERWTVFFPIFFFFGILFIAYAYIIIICKYEIFFRLIETLLNVPIKMSTLFILISLSAVFNHAICNFIFYCCFYRVLYFVYCVNVWCERGKMQKKEKKKSKSSNILNTIVRIVVGFYYFI